jgi:hypothetical protein
MISNALLQKALIAKLKADTPLVTLLGADTEVREQQWQGREFTYPLVRVNLIQQLPMFAMDPCEWFSLTFSVYSMSEDRSSYEADNIASAVNDILHDKGWSEDSDGYRFHKCRSIGLNSAVRMSERIWRAEAFFNARLHTL